MVASHSKLLLDVGDMKPLVDHEKIGTDAEGEEPYVGTGK